MRRARRISKSAGLAILRIGVGAMMLTHGWPKFANFSERAAKFADPIGVGPELSLALAIFAELGCSILLILGLGTRIAAFPLLFTMLVAAFIVHGDDPFKKQEFALLYAVPFLTLMLTGGGRFSLDALIWRFWRRRGQSKPESENKT